MGRKIYVSHESTCYGCRTCEGDEAEYDYARGQYFYRVA